MTDSKNIQNNPYYKVGYAIGTISEIELQIENAFKFNLIDEIVYNSIKATIIRSKEVVN